MRSFPGIIVRQDRTDRKQMVLLREPFGEWKKVHLLYCCNQVWMKNGVRIPWKVTAVCETFKIYCLTGKLRTKGVFEEPFFEGPIIPFGSLVEYYLISAKDQSRIHQFGKKVLPGLFLGYALYAGGIWKGVTYWLQTLRSWKRWTHRNSAKKDSMRRR